MATEYTKERNVTVYSEIQNAENILGEFLFEGGLIVRIIEIFEYTLKASFPRNFSQNMENKNILRTLNPKSLKHPDIKPPKLHPLLKIKISHT